VDGYCGECGDLVVHGDEACDEGPYSATCDVDCTEVVCGDGVVNLAAGEYCEPSVEAACLANCTPVPPLLVSVEASYLSWGDTAQCTMIGTYTDGPPVDLTFSPGLEWGTHDYSLASVFGDGVVQFVAAGEVEISGVIDGFGASTVIPGGDELDPPAESLSSLELLPASITLSPGEWVQFRAYYTDPVSGGYPVEITSEPDLASGVGDPLVAVPYYDLAFMALRPGTTTMHIVYLGEGASAQITVVEP
jgi:hypothetical protein